MVICANLRKELEKAVFDSYISGYICGLLRVYLCGGMYFSLLLPSGWGFLQLCAFCWDTEKVKEGLLSFSWCTGGELGFEGEPLWGFGNWGSGGVCLRIRCGLSERVNYWVSQKSD